MLFGMNHFIANMYYIIVNKMRVFIFGGSELGTACAIYLRDCGFTVLVADRERPTCICRLRSFAQVIFTGHCSVETRSA